MVTRILYLSAGWALIALGAAGLFLPFLQGLLCIALGLLVLSRHSPWAKRLLERFRARYPRLAAKLQIRRKRRPGTPEGP